MTADSDTGEIVPARTILALLRIYLGLMFLIPAVPRLFGGWFAAGFEQNMLQFLQFATPRATPFYQHFVAAVVVPHSTAFATAVEAGELLVGVALVTGTATRLAVVGALFLLVNYMLAKGMWPWQAGSNDAAFIFIAVALALGAAGRTLGVDRYLAHRWPRVLLW